MRRKGCVPKAPRFARKGARMAKRGARRKVSFLLATTFAIGTGPAVIGAMAKDETPSAASGARAQAIQLDTITVESKPRVRKRPARAIGQTLVSARARIAKFGVVGSPEGLHVPTGTLADVDQALVAKAIERRLVN